MALPSSYMNAVLGNTHSLIDCALGILSTSKNFMPTDWLIICANAGISDRPISIAGRGSDTLTPISLDLLFSFCSLASASLNSGGTCHVLYLPPERMMKPCTGCGNRPNTSQPSWIVY